MECNAEQNRRMENSKENTMICKKKLKINSKQKGLNKRIIKKHKHSIIQKYYSYYKFRFQPLFVNLRKQNT
jgi:hypothetical protein